MDYLWAFVVGGLICVVGQILIDKTHEGLKWGALLYNQTKEWRWNQ